MLYRNIFTALLLCPLAFVLACGGDDDNQSTTTLDSTQSKAVASALLAGVGTAISGGSNVSPKFGGPNFATSEVSIDETENCDVSGTVDIDGDITVDFDETNNTLDSNHTLTQTFNDCTETDENGNDITVDGSITYAGTMDFAVSDTNVSGTSTGTLDGAVTVSGEGVETGTCAVDISVAVEVNGSSFTSTVSGTVCGESVNFSENSGS